MYILGVGTMPTLITRAKSIQDLILARTSSTILGHEEIPEGEAVDVEIADPETIQLEQTPIPIRERTPPRRREGSPTLLETSSDRTNLRHATAGLSSTSQKRSRVDAALRVLNEVTIISLRISFYFSFMYVYYRRLRRTDYLSL